MQNQAVVIIEQDDALTDVFKDAGFQGVEHTVGGVDKAAPVQQKGRQAVSADGIVQQGVNGVPRPEQKHGVYQHDDQNAQDHIAVLRPVFPGDLAHFPNQQDQDHQHQYIGENQMHPVKGLHLIAVPRDKRLSRHIMDGDLPEGIHGEDDDLKGRIQDTQFEGCLSQFPEFAFGKVHGEDEQAQQHEIDGDKIDAGHDRHIQIIVGQDADQIADIHHGCTHAGKTKIPPGGLVFPEGLPGQEHIDYGNQDGDFYIYVQKYHFAHPEIRLSVLLVPNISALYIIFPRISITAWKKL